MTSESVELVSLIPWSNCADLVLQEKGRAICTVIQKKNNIQTKKTKQDEVFLDIEFILVN